MLEASRTLPAARQAQLLLEVVPQEHSMFHACMNACAGLVPGIGHNT